MRVRHPKETIINPGNLQLESKFGGKFPANTRVDVKNGRFDSADLNKSGRLEAKFSVIKSFLTKGHQKSTCTAPGELTLFSSTEPRSE